MGKAKLRQILAAEKGKVQYLEKQKKLQKEARKRKRKHAEAEEDDDMEVEDMDVNGANGEDENDWEDESESDDERVIDTSKLDDSDSDSEDEDDDDEDEDEEDDSEVQPKGILKASKPTPVANGEDDDEDEEEDDEEDDDIPLSEISEGDNDPDADIIPRQKLTINNHPALLAARASIALPITASTPFAVHHTVTTTSPVAIKDVHDDLTRELAFYTQALDAARRGRELLLSEGAPFTRPTDYFAEMVKSEEHMGRIKERMKEDAARKQASADAKRQRDLKKFGKAVQVAKLQERQKEKREMLDKISLLKRKRAGADLGDENEGDPFDIAIEKATKDTTRRRGDHAPNAKRQRKNEKFGFGGRKKFAKSGDALSSGDMSGFSAKGMKRNSFGGGGGKKKPAPRLGKSKRQARR
ncbi:rRNA-processing protein and EBNA1-binding protein ebp2 [Orbilia brochopaga]|uniref:rRNA-processing protein and EBNA1-binding protein ebp2 n=1 Tax=Orbilia brochopaga TaxID=3140254 RepID=A0AAV9UWA8_9PEZI